ncbi:MAG: hypothetical protein ACLTSX_03620 [Collinsella sp.]
MAQNYWGDEPPLALDLPPAADPHARDTAASTSTSSPTPATWAVWWAPAVAA